MKLFEPLYLRAMQWARHRHAPSLLTALSFLEAIVFPIPPEVMLAPMCLAQPRRGWYFASLSLFGSMLGMFVAYAIGYYAIEMVMPWLERFGYAAQFEDIKREAAANGFWLLLIAGFTPVPFKIFTLASGAVGMPMLPFVAGAMIGRGKRVYLVAAAIRWGGARAEALLHRYAERIGWLAMVALLVLIGVIWWRGGLA
ncbi:MAG: YqaA family protein [Lysobacteraceae bacterium]